MRSFIVSILATLAFALFTYAAPMPAQAAPVYAIAARDDKPTLEKTFNKCIDGMKPHTDELLAIKAGVKVDVKAVAAVLVKIKVVLVACIADLKVLAKLKFEDIICGEDGVALKVEVFAALCVKLILCLVEACISILAVCSAEIKLVIVVLIKELLCLLGELLTLCLEICVSIRVQLLACILAQITACFKIFLDLKIDILVKLCNLSY